MEWAGIWDAIIIRWLSRVILGLPLAQPFLPIIPLALTHSPLLRCRPELYTDHAMCFPGEGQFQPLPPTDGSSGPISPQSRPQISSSGRGKLGLTHFSDECCSHSREVSPAALLEGNQVSNPADITWYWNGAGLWLYQVHGHERGCSVHSHAPEGYWGSILGVS